MSDYFSIRWMDGVVRMIDQRLLPEEVVYRDYTRCSEVADAIKEMVIRGAPAIGVAAGFGLALVAANSNAHSTHQLILELKSAEQELKSPARLR